MTTIYHYHEKTAELLGSSAAAVSPLEPDVFLIPANATRVAPPAAQVNEAVIFNPHTGMWTTVPDLRGTTYYLPPNYMPHKHEELGPLPEGAVLEILLSEQKARALKRALSSLNGYLSENISKNITVNAHTYTADMLSMTMLFAVISEYESLKNKNPKGQIKWQLANDTVIEVDDTELSAVRKAYAIRASACIDHADHLRKLIQDAGSQAALDAINISTHWPE